MSNLSVPLVHADLRQFEPGVLQIADTVTRALLYPCQRVRTEFLAVRDIRLDQVEQFVDLFVHHRFHWFPDFLDPIKVLVLRYAVVENQASGLAVVRADDKLIEHGYTLASTVSRSCGEELPLATAQIPWEAPSRNAEWRTWAALQPRFLMGPLRFAPFTCCPPCPSCTPNRKIQYQRGDRPLAACLVTMRDVRAGERLIVEWGDINILASSSPLACGGLHTPAAHMARPAKYETPEARAEARRETKRAYYARNAERERQIAKDRWNSRRAKQVEARRKEAKGARVLCATEKVLGGALMPDSTTPWDALYDALQEDLGSWRGRRSTTDLEEYHSLTRELVANSAERTLQRVMQRIERKVTLLSTVYSVAHTADGVLLDKNPRRYATRFLQLSRDAMAIQCVIDDLLFRFRNSPEELRVAYEGRTLYWQ
ncbi:hypothetical protein EXIGLDRAFT_777618 [Exidia glandulosa HHB12029]|uniref:SET domain-containing protein n=1 Tax=Exidia glandulosa HHB12029 TaxID=1314781 RepID=A0A165CXR9_EXIGL|nr:hypothetical protein EXIGLDRAFT_777618 [Exidia glandulosa HHB12029]